MRMSLIAALIVASLPASVVAQTPQTAAPTAAAKHYTTADTDIGTLLENPAAKAVLDKHLPGFSTNSQIDMAKGMTLASIQQYSPETMTDKVLAAIDADLATIPVK